MKLTKEQWETLRKLDALFPTMPDEKKKEIIFFMEGFAAGLSAAKEKTDGVA